MCMRVPYASQWPFSSSFPSLLLFVPERLTGDSEGNEEAMSQPKNLSHTFAASPRQFRACIGKNLCDDAGPGETIGA